VAITLSTSFGAAAAAGIYNSLSPLAKDFVVEEGEEEHKEVVDRVRENESTVELADKIKRGQGSTSYPHHHHHSKFHKHQNYKLLKKSVSSISREGRHVENPQWEGGLFDCYQEPRISLFSTACLPCVLGWNLDRMGFGNRYVHIATFLLLCSAPCLVFMVAAVNIDNRYGVCSQPAFVAKY
jgi:Cys-rich protein (TIGR01571 family)